MAKASTTLGGLTFTARADGGSGNLIGIAIAISSSPVVATASGRLITITLQHNGSALTTSISTKAQVAAAVAANPAVNALIESSVGDATIFPYTDPPVGYTYLTGGSEVLTGGDIVVSASLYPTRTRFGVLSGAIIASAVMSATASKIASASSTAVSTATATADVRVTEKASTAVTAVSSALATASIIEAKQAQAIAIGTSSSLVSADVIFSLQAAATATGSSSSVASGSLLAGGRIAATATSVAVTAANAFYSASGQAISQSSSEANIGKILKAESDVVGSSSSSATIELIRTSLTICDVVRDVLLSWGMEHPCSAPKMAKIAAVNVLNQAMQVLWNQAKDRNYWTQSTISLAMSSGTSSQILSDSVQNVVGPARLSTGETLVPLANISELENFQNSFLETSSAIAPCAYYVERNYQSGGDPARCTLMITPAPIANITVNLDVVTESPRYTILDLDTCPLCPIPHKYVESLLLPISRYLAMHSHLFIQRERQEAIAQAYLQARQLLDVADPLPGMSGENAKFRKEEPKS